MAAKAVDSRSGGNLQSAPARGVGTAGPHSYHASKNLIRHQELPSPGDELILRHPASTTMVPVGVRAIRTRTAGNSPSEECDCVPLAL